MKRFEGVLICSDLDGTLLRSNHEISDENVRAIQYFKDNGGLFTFVTGRMPFFVSDIWSRVRPNAPFGCINGGGIYDWEQRKYLYAAELPKEALLLAEEVDRRLDGIGIQINTLEHVYFCRENPSMQDFRAATGVPNLQAPIRGVSEPMAKILFGDRREEMIARLAQILSEHPLADHFDFIRSEKTLYEILPKGTNKGVVLPKLCELLPQRPRLTIAVGDYHNDIPMLRGADIGIAVSNAHPDVLAIADRVTVSNNEHAIAQIIRNLESGILE